MTDSNRKPNDVNKGLNVKDFAISILVAVVVIFVGALIFIKTHKGAMAPAVNPRSTSAASPQ